MLLWSGVAVLGCLAVSLCQATCPTPDVQETAFGLSKLEGSWLVTYRFPNPVEDNCKCDALYVTERSYLSKGILTGGCYNTVDQQYELMHSFVESVDENGKFVGKTYDGAGNIVSMTFYLAATDYDTYAVLYSCSDLGEYAAILSRNGHTSQAVKDAVDTAMVSHGVNPSKFVAVVQDCYNI